MKKFGKKKTRIELQTFFQGEKRKFSKNYRATQNNKKKHLFDTVKIIKKKFI